MIILRTAAAVIHWVISASWVAACALTPWMFWYTWERAIIEQEQSVVISAFRIMFYTSIPACMVLAAAPWIMRRFAR